MAKRFADARRSFSPIFVISALLLSLVGQANADERVNLLYQPTAFGHGGSGELYLTQNIQPASTGRSSVEWVIGTEKNGDGDITDNIVSPRSPVEMLMDASAREFKAAGYNVLTADAFPTGATKGIRLVAASIKMEEIDRIYKIETKCTVQVTVEPWRNGAALKRLNYENSYSDSTILDRETILNKTLQTTLQELMARVVREVTVMLEKK